MQFTVTAILALVGSALAQTPNFNPLTNPLSGEVIPAGKMYPIKWTPQGGNGAPVSLYAYAGESASTLQEIGVIATGVEASLGRFEWNVDAAIGGKYKAYGIKIALASDKEVYQWSNPFTVSAAVGSSSTSSVVSTKASSSASSSSSMSVKTDSSSVTSTKATVSSTTVAPITSSTMVTSTPIGNLSTSATRATSSQVTLVTSTSSRAAGTSPTVPVTVPTGGAVTKGASSIAIIAGLAMAVLAL
ncbi:hypothetical protein GGTG_09625 [Gaeumannomyces tritici R3-111a-1]|uniref:Yeast cell wall synthesis Kre9/Knh1-like N-terminal domain-containing protein n=1 Tax=Gaeumannomyces tritici (strain R3-111a-1) TaxID=644352 RepID=J3P7Y6_GAET3|nr:hypothetical protein GGTG_09625 [Gaeumannomyces tritici R3-111a-1]EJT72769.1 hypothetical protein GGTG_09625 [Gaeumannomyces tritici R3-111a-1]